MSKVINSSGEYTVKDSGETVQYQYSFTAFDNLEDCINELGEDTVLKLAQRMTKVDANNTAREKAKTANGHSARQPMSEEAKAEAKAERTADRETLKRIKALSPEQRRALGL